jgi:adenine deaminase
MKLPKQFAPLAVVGILTFVALSGQGPVPSAIDPCTGARELRMTNGRFVTMDRRNSIVSEVTIQDGRFVSVGSVGNRRLSPCTREINVRGRAVLPGLIDNHNHIVLLGIRPGYHTPLERESC